MSGFVGCTIMELIDVFVSIGNPLDISLKDLPASDDLNICAPSRLKVKSGYTESCTEPTYITSESLGATATPCR